MGKMMIDDFEYHARMLSDIARRNGAALVLYYDPEPKIMRSKCIRAMSGDDKAIMAAIGSLIAEVAKEARREPHELCEILGMIFETYKDRLP